jgi:hypothetical protein
MKNAVEDIDIMESSRIADSNVNLYSHCENQYEGSQNIKSRTAVLPKEMESVFQRDTCFPMLIIIPFFTIPCIFLDQNHVTIILVYIQK